MPQGPARAEPDFLCDQDEMLNIRPEDFKRMVRAGAMATAARDAHNVREATPQTGPQGLPPNGREEVDEPTAATHDFQQPHALIVGNGEEPEVLLLNGRPSQPGARGSRAMDDGEMAPFRLGGWGW